MHLKGQLRLYMQLPMVMAVLLIAVNVWIYGIDRRAGAVMLIFVIVYIGMLIYLYLYGRAGILKDLVEFAAQYGIVQNTLLKELALPDAILLENGKIVWLNEQFEQILGKRVGDIYISKLVPELNSSIFPKEENDIVEMNVYYEDEDFVCYYFRQDTASLYNLAIGME